MTNLIHVGVLVVTSLVTNVTTNHPLLYPNGHAIPCPDGMIGCLVNHFDRGKPVEDMSEIRVTTDVYWDTTYYIADLNIPDGKIKSRVNVTNWTDIYTAQVTSKTNWLRATNGPPYQAPWTYMMTNLPTMIYGITNLTNFIHIQTNPVPRIVTNILGTMTNDGSRVIKPTPQPSVEPKKAK